MRNGLPSGEQIEIRAGDQRVVVVEVGAGLRSYTVGEREVIDGYGADEMASAGRGQVLMPWPNRIEDGAYEFNGGVRWVAWSAVERDGDHVVLEHTLHPQPGYPFTLALRIEYTLSEAGLQVMSTATNIGERPCPYGTGQHPYMRLGAEGVDPLVLRAPGQTVLYADARGLPAGLEPVEGTAYDFRQPRTIGATKLDNAFTDLERDDDGRARVELRLPDDEVALSVWLDERYAYLQLFTGDVLPSVGRRSLAVEPMTCPPNAFRTGEDVIVLEPGASTTASWGIQA
jgi:aldose 1-epimerase